MSRLTTAAGCLRHFARCFLTALVFGLMSIALHGQPVRAANGGHWCSTSSHVVIERSARDVRGFLFREWDL